MNLPKAIDAAVVYVRSHPEQMTAAEVDEFCGLADDVYTQSYPAGLVDAMPQVPELQPELESQEMHLPPVQFISKLNLPGDWDYPSGDDDLLPSSYGPDDPIPEVGKRQFLVAACPRWFADLEILRRLAEGKKNRTGRPRKGETDRDTLVIAALAAHHQYVSSGAGKIHIGNYNPATIRGLSKATTGLSTAAISRFFTKEFTEKYRPGHQGYVAACNRDNNKIGLLLAKWQDDLPENYLDLAVEEELRQRNQYD